VNIATASTSLRRRAVEAAPLSLASTRAAANISAFGGVRLAPNFSVEAVIIDLGRTHYRLDLNFICLQARNHLSPAR